MGRPRRKWFWNSALPSRERPWTTAQHSLAETNSSEASAHLEMKWRPDRRDQHLEQSIDATGGELENGKVLLRELSKILEGAPARLRPGLNTGCRLSRG